MKRKSVWIVGFLLTAGGGGWWLTARNGTDDIEYRFVGITRGDLESTVTATGTVQATETVEVGTQVSGQISRIFIDFNDRVTAGDLIALIDPTILQQEVRSAEVNLARNQAELDQSRRELERTVELHATQVVTDSELDLARYRFELADASFRSAEINLERARRNLEYSEIRAPISGVVVSRNVEVGQTVAASLSAPILFLLAQDLAEMEILASVDESDIGQIREGQPVRFTVQAYPERQFRGTVQQVRLQSTTQDNVVTYSVVVSAENPSGALLPGMTATLDIVLDREEDVLRVSNTALRFRPTEAMLEEFEQPRGPDVGADSEGDGESPFHLGPRGGGEPRTDPRAGGFASGDMDPERIERIRARLRAAGGAAPGGGFPRRPGGDGAPGTLWYLDENGELRMTRVRTGLSDGIQTSIRSGTLEIAEGLQVIASVTSGEVTQGGVNPFQPTSGGGFRRFGGF